MAVDRLSRLFKKKKKMAKNNTIGLWICLSFVLVLSQVILSPRLIDTVKSAAAIDFEGYYRVPSNSSSSASSETSHHPQDDHYLLGNLPHPTMVCDDSQQQYGCCSSWNVNVDEWWMHHPDWHVVAQNRTHSCFAPYPEPKATFFRKLYETQWLLDDSDNNNNTTVDGDDNALDIYNRTTLPPLQRNCSHVLQNFQISSGMGASFGQIMKGFYFAHRRRQPYQLSKHREGMRWMYVPKDKSSWAWCPSMDLNCYILPVSNCLPTYKHKDKIGRIVDNKSLHYKWLMQYLLRFRHKLRWKIQYATDSLFVRTKNTLYPQNEDDNNCTAIHVRRGDSGLGREPFRRYAALSEYIQAGKIGHDEVIAILTDDVTTIQEATQFYPDYTWMYMERPRVKGTKGGFEGHIPSGDEAFEMVAIQAEVAVAAKCHKLVHGKSGFIQEVLVAREAAGLEPPASFYVDTAIGRQEARKYNKFGQNKRSQVMIKHIFVQAEEGLRNRTAHQQYGSKKRTME